MRVINCESNEAFRMSWVKMSENERALASELNELNETNEFCEMSEQLITTLRDEAEIIWSEADGSISYTTHLYNVINTD